MSDDNNPPSLPSPSPSSVISPTTPTPTVSDNSVEAQHSLLYLSLKAALQHPSCVSPSWIDTIADFKNNPRTLSNAPYNDGALHYVDKKQKVLCMTFPAVLDLDGKYGKIGPYFSLMGERNVQVCFFQSSRPFSQFQISETYHPYFSKNESHLRTFTSHHPFCTRPSDRGHRM
jgi:hypothetical protein